MGRTRRSLHQCCCERCHDEPGGEVAKLHTFINRFLAILDERGRRLFAGVVFQMNHGLPTKFDRHREWKGRLAQTARITGLRPRTILKGHKEMQEPDLLTRGRIGIRKEGGGRKRADRPTDGSKH